MCVNTAFGFQAYAAYACWSAAAFAFDDAGDACVCSFDTSKLEVITDIQVVGLQKLIQTAYICCIFKFNHKMLNVILGVIDPT